MIVITVTSAPQSLKGDLTRWLTEISTGVYVGKVSARVREQLWKRIESSIKAGRATMVYNKKNEQGLEFRTIGTEWNPVDFDGITLMLRPTVKTAKSSHEKSSSSKAARYVILDLETTGLDPHHDDIIEIGAIRVVNGIINGEFQTLVKTEKQLSKTIIDLTGITNTLLDKKGLHLEKALRMLNEFLGYDPVICYNSDFDHKFLLCAYRSTAVIDPDNRYIDVLSLARKSIKGLPNYRLKTVSEYLKINEQPRHRALADCFTLLKVYAELMK